MSALSVLYLVIPFPLAFILHDAEELFVQHRWMLAHRDVLCERFPAMRKMVESLCTLNTRAFAFAALEELVLLLVATCYLLIGGAVSMQIWSALFMAFSVHLLVHIGQAIAVRGYVPGLITSFLLLPYSYIGMQSIWNAMHGYEIVMWCSLGLLIMLLNLRFAHWFGKWCDMHMTKL